MELLERDNYLQELQDKYDNLSDGNGFVILISGEAGVGKTSLVETFLNKIDCKGNILWGACDDLFTPRPLGPLYDIAAQLNDSLLKLLDSHAERATIFTRFLKVLQDKSFPNILIIEDIHWADESTLDLIKYLGRRTNRINSLFIITYRDDEIGPEHPLRFVLGDISSKNLNKFKLTALSERTVNELANSNGIKNLFQITWGNPFLITELLSNKGEGVPSTIKDSVLTRVSHLTNKAREFVELISIIPTRAEKWLVNDIISINSKILDECMNSGILKTETEYVSFKHELSRMAVEESLSDSKKFELNEAVLQTLLKQKNTESYLARIIHHAIKADNKEVIINYASAAAKQASSLGAHRLAADHYQNALKYSNNLPFEKQVDLYEGKSYECYLTGKVEEGIKAGETVLKLLRRLPDPAREGENYRKISRMLWNDCEDEKSEKYLNKALEILEKFPISKQLVMAYSNKSQSYMLREEYKLAVEWGDKALKLGRKLNDLEIEAHALNNIGTAKMLADDPSGQNYLKKSIQISLDNNFYEHASRGYVNLGSNYLERKNIKEANNYLMLAMEYANGKDLNIFELYSAGHYALAKLFSGDWDEALEIVNNILNSKNIPKRNRIIPISIIGLIRARRNDPGAMGLLNESNLLILNVRSVDQITVKGALAEAYWLRNEFFKIVDEIKTYYLKLKDTNNPWATGAIAYWLWKADYLSDIPNIIAEPYLLQIKNDWKSAAELWEELKCPYEQALALSEGDKDAVKKALEILSRLGASATFQRVKQFLREKGITSIPKGPRKNTRSNPKGLTSRQIEVLKLLGKGLSNNEISNQLYISPKTVDHHVSAILAKLNVHSRNEAASFVHSKDLFEKIGNAVR